MQGYKKMNKKNRIYAIISFGIIFVFFCGFLILYFGDVGRPETDPKSIAKKYKELSYKNGICFRNDRVVVYANELSEQQIKDLKEEYSADVFKSDTKKSPCYIIVFKEKLSYKDIEKTIKKLKEKDYIIDACFDDIEEDKVNLYLLKSPVSR